MSAAAASADERPAAERPPAERLVLPRAELRPALAPPPLLPGRLNADAVEPPAVRRLQVAPAMRVLPFQFQRKVIIGGQFQATQANTRQELQGGGLNTSEELERLLERAQQVAAERPDLAPVLWQRILDEGSAAFARGSTKNSVPLRRQYEVFRPFAEESLRSMVAAGAEALRHYRLHSDGPARALFARQGAGREAALGELVRRYFLTTVGDDAAFELSCRLLESGDFTAADHVLAQLEQYPDSNIAKDDIALRRAVAQSRLGRTDRAEELLKSLGDSSALVAAIVETDVQQHRSSSGQVNIVTELPSTPAGLDAADQLGAVWEYQPQWSLKGTKTTTNNQAIMSGQVNGRPMIYVRQAGGNYVQTTLEDKDIPDLAMSQLASNWTAAAWRPTSQPVVADGRIYLKSETRVVCCEAATGRVLWMGRPTIYPLDDSSRQMAEIAAHGVTLTFPSATVSPGVQPKTMTEIMLFADRVQQGMAVGGGEVFALEGVLETAASRKKPVDNIVQRGFGQMLAGQQKRQNELTCYAAATGKLKWTVSGASVIAEGTYFLSAPLLLDKTVVIATGAESQLGIAALDRETGKLLWKTVLSDLTAKSSAMIPVGIAVDDGCLYVANGAGTLFSINRTDGALRWAVTYPRQISSRTERDPFDGSTGVRVQLSLQENFIARHGGTIVVAPCDSSHVMAFDVTDGALQWDSPLPPEALKSAPGYVVGIRDGRLFLGNNEWLWRINLSGGRIEWDRKLERSCGRGVLTAQSLLVPQGRKVLQIDPASGELLRTTEVDTPDSEPVGNLIVQGPVLLVASAARLMALKTITEASPMPAAAPNGSPAEKVQP